MYMYSMNQNKVPVVRNTWEGRIVITIVQRQAKSMVFKLGYYAWLLCISAGFYQVCWFSY